MTLNYDIFGNLTEPPESIYTGGRRYPRMREIHGTKEGNLTCKTCKHCLCIDYHNRTYYKCDLWIVSHSSATDIRLKDKACNKYESEDNK